MSRQSVHALVRLPAEAGQAPGAYQVTAEIRLLFPARERQVGARALSQAVAEAWAKYEETAPDRRLENEPAAGDGKLLLSVAEAAELLNIGKNQVYELVYSERLPSTRFGEQGKVIRIPTAAVERFVAEIYGG